MIGRLRPLFEACKFAGLSLRNRFVMAPMTRQTSPGGIPGANVAQYYRQRAEGNVGLIITEGVGVDHPSSIGSGHLDERNQPVLHGDLALAGWASVVQSVHEAGGLIVPQLWHMGPMRRFGTGPYPSAESLRPSGIWGPSGSTSISQRYIEAVRHPTRPMTEREIEEVIEAFARSAVNARKVGFDGVAIHGAHGYLVDSFLWSSTNLRTDRWGGSPAGRARFAAEIVAAIRRATGPEFPIIFRFSQWKLQDYGARIAETPAELEQLLAPLVDAGADLFDVSTRVFHATAFAGSALTLGGWTRKLTGKPTIVVGGIGLDDTGEPLQIVQGRLPENLRSLIECFERGEFDLAALGRVLLKDAGWVARLGAAVRLAESSGSAASSRSANKL